MAFTVNNNIKYM